MLSSTNARLAAARRLTRRSARRETGRFLAEGPQAVAAAISVGAAREVFATVEAIDRHPELTHGAAEIADRDAAGLSETVTPQGIVAVCELAQPGLAELLATDVRLLAVLVEPNDPGNLGTIIRTADAAGADAVIIDGGVDPYNGKVVRASAGSIFHLPVVAAGVAQLLAAGSGLQVLATSGDAADDLDELADSGALAAPTAWLFGNEAHGLPREVLDAVRAVRIPIRGRAESLNLASAAAVCLYASARAHRQPTGTARDAR